MNEMQITDDEWKVVEERAKELPKGFYIGIIGKSLSKNELITSIKSRDDVGRAYAKMQFQIMKWCVKQTMQSG